MSDAPLPIRAEAAEDAAALDALITAAFGRPDEARLVAGLRAAGALSLSLVALQADRLVGHVAFSPVSVQGAALPGVLGLAPLAVRPDRQRRGIGSALVAEALDRLRREGCRLVVVLGEPAFYRRFGFRPAGALGLTYPGPGAAEAFQALMLAPPLTRGLVRYHRLFDSF